MSCWSATPGERQQQRCTPRGARLARPLSCQVPNWPSQLAQPAARTLCSAARAGVCRELVRDFSYNGIRALITLVLAIIFATLFKGRGKTTEQYTDVLNISGAMYAASVFSSVLYLFMVGRPRPQPAAPAQTSVLAARCRQADAANARQC